MAESLKTFFSPAVVRRLAADTFIRKATAGLDHLELLARAKHIASALIACLPPSYPDAIDVLLRSLGPQRRWAVDDNAHVRRLVSEGTRLRLPWARRVAWLERNPERVVELLDLLKDDSASVVRRSVANNLNDLGKLRADLLARVGTAWLIDATGERRKLVEHAAQRGKARRALRAATARRRRQAEDRARRRPLRSPARPDRRQGGHAIRAAQPVEGSAGLRVDAAVHFVKARAATSAKVFKLRRLTLAARGRTEMRAEF